MEQVHIADLGSIILGRALVGASLSPPWHPTLSRDGFSIGVFPENYLLMKSEGDVRLVIKGLVQTLALYGTKDGTQA